ncbi:hypothetical protein U6R69_12115, partial [Cutibacterium acnes]
WVCVGGGGVCSVCWAVGGCVCGSWWWLCLDVFLSGLTAGECSGMVFRAAALVVVWLAGSAGWFWDRGFVVSGLVWQGWSGRLVMVSAWFVWGLLWWV